MSNEKSDKENINAFVATKSYGVVGDYKSQIQALKKEVNSTILNDYLSKVQISQTFFHFFHF